MNQRVYELEKAGGRLLQMLRFVRRQEYNVNPGWWQCKVCGHQWEAPEQERHEENCPIPEFREVLEKVKNQPPDLTAGEFNRGEPWT